MIISEFSLLLVLKTENTRMNTQNENFLSLYNTLHGKTLSQNESKTDTIPYPASFREKTAFSKFSFFTRM